MSFLCACFGSVPKPVPIDFWDCSRLGLTELPREVCKHRATLQSLFLNINHLKDLPRALFTFENLTELDLSENDILFLPPSISQLVRLTSLNLCKNSIQGVPDDIQYCQSLTSLDLSSNPLGSICGGVTELRQLRRLIMNDCSLEELPPNIGKLTKLETFELRENLLRSLPMSFCHLTALEKLDLGVNEFQLLSSVIGSLESLNELWLDANTLSTLPDEVGKLANLKFLELSENHIMVLPLTLGALISLTDLYLNENLLTFLPDSIGELCNLRVLRADSNRIAILPDTVGGWKNVSELNLSHNHLTELAPEMGDMDCLATLYLDENLLTEIPEELCQCASLQTLSLRNNQIMELPEEAGGLRMLSVFNLIGNRIQYLPYSLTKLTNLTAIWLSENQSRPVMDLQMTRDEEGEKKLTCFLLPQQGEEIPFDGSPESTSPTGEDPSLVPPPRVVGVAFDPQVEDKKSKITRDLTPFPKELHAKAIAWRAARELMVSEEVKQEGVGGGLVQLRSPSRRSTYHRPYSLLKALSDPLDVEDLNPIRRAGSTGSRGSRGLSPNRSIPSIAEKDDEERNGGGGRRGEGSPRAHRHPISGSPRTIATFPSSHSSPARAVSVSVKAAVTTAMTERDTVEHKQLLLDAGEGEGEDEDYGSNVLSPPPLPTPIDSEPATPKDAPPQIPSPPLDFSKGQSDGHGWRAGSLAAVSVDGDDMALLLNSNTNNNNNNNNNNNIMGVASTRLLPHVHVPEQVNFDPQEFAPDECDFAETSRQQLPPPPFHYHSDANRSLYHSHASIESGFEADSEASSWYLSLDASPVHPPLPNTSQPCHAHQARGSGAQADKSSSHADKSCSQADRSGSVRCSHSLSRDRDGYDHLPSLSSLRASGSVLSAEEGPYAAVPPPVFAHRAARHRGNRSGSLDSTDLARARLPPPARPHSQPSRPHPLPPSQPHHRTCPLSHTATPPPQTDSQPDGAIQIRPMELRRDGAATQHTRSHSQPEALAYLVATATRSGRAVTPAQFGSAQESPSGRHWGDGKAVEVHRDDPGHRLRSLGKEAPLPHSRAVCRGRSLELRSPSDEWVYGGRGTPEMRTRASWLSGNDSGFGSINRTPHPLATPHGILGEAAVGHDGVTMEVDLVKAPTLGLGITGGPDGENGIRPGDKGYHVYKVTDGLPAQRSGKVACGDQLLEVNGIDVSPLSTQEVLALLTGPERVVSLVLYREPSVTLL